MGYFDAPNSGDREASYVRFSNEVVVKGKTRFAVGGGATGPVTLESSTGVVATLPLADSVFDTATIPDGHYIGKAINCKPMDFVVRNGPTPVRGPLVPLNQANMLDEKNNNSQGVTWIPYSDPTPLPKGNLIEPRNQALFSLFPTQTNRDRFWMRPLVTSNGVWSALKVWLEDEFGNIHIGHKQLYFRGSLQGLSIGNLRDGPYGKGAVGSPVCIREMHDGSLLVTAINAGAKRIWPDLRVETLWGWRLPDGPAPCISFTSTLTSEQKLASIKSKYEMVGDTEPKNPWCCIQDPTDLDIIWIANTDGHHVLKYSISTKKTLGVVGSPTAVMGHSIGGIGTNVLMRRPRGLSFGPDGLLYVTQAWNHSIGTIDTKTLEFKEVWRSKNNWDTFVPDTQGIRFLPYNAVQLRPFWEVDGPTGVGSCHHPQQCDFTSEGKLIFGCDHTRAINEFDPATGIKRLLVGVIDDPFVEPTLRHQAWVSLAVNKDGVGELKDNIAYADWQQASLRVYRKDGTNAWRPIYDPAGKGTRFGRNNRVWTAGYPWCVGWGKDRFLWADAGSECLQEMSVRQPTDKDFPDATILAGMKAWSAGGGSLSMAGIYDDLGFSQLGLPQFQDMATWSDDDIKAWLLKERPGIGSIDDVVNYIRYSQQPPKVAPPIDLHITEKMIDAGENALKDSMGESYRDGVVAIYTAMELAR